jgi:hypothetical protein
MAAPWEVLPVSPAAPTIIVGEDVDGGPPWEVLWAGSAALTTVVKGDVDGGPPGRCCRRVWQHPPLLLEKTSMGGLGGVVGGSGSTHHHY